MANVTKRKLFNEYSLKLRVNMKIYIKEKEKTKQNRIFSKTLKMSLFPCNCSFDSTQAKVTRKKRIFECTICNFHGSVMNQMYQ